MTLREFYTEVLAATEGMTFSPMWEVTDMNTLCYDLCKIQIPDDILEEISFEKEKMLYDEVFSGFNPKLIAKRGSYLVQLNYVLETFLPNNVTPYKKVTQTVYQTSKMLAKYKNLDAFVKEVNGKCSEKDDKKTFAFLDNFRLDYALPSMFFNSACFFFSKTGILDVPYLSPSIKRVLFSKLSMEEDNYSCFHILSLLMKISDSCGYEVSQRLEAYAKTLC